MDLQMENSAWRRTPRFGCWGSCVQFLHPRLATSFCELVASGGAKNLKYELRGCYMETQTKTRKCHICGLRPAKSENGFCHDCQNSINAERQQKRQAAGFDKYIHYQGVTVALKAKNGTYVPSFYSGNIKRIPRCRLINLDGYCAGYTREQIKKFKRLCKSFAK